MEDCVFCKIVEGELPAKKIYEDEQILAFYDINPIAKIHILVIPKKHINSFAEITEEDNELIVHISMKIKEIAKEAGISEAGYRVLTNVGEDGGQAVKHLHFHILGGEKLPTR